MLSGFAIGHPEQRRVPLLVTHKNERSSWHVNSKRLQF